MPEVSYDKKKVRRAMLIAPAVGLLGIVPFVFQLDLTVLLFLGGTAAALIVSYLLALIFGTPGYLLLRSLGYAQTPYLMAYAVLLSIATPIVFGDIYALLMFGPPTLLAAGTFCYLRGSPLEPGSAPEGI